MLTEEKRERNNLVAQGGHCKMWIEKTELMKMDNNESSLIVMG